jgi:hypothetical protein
MSSLSVFWGEEPDAVKSKPCIYCEIEKPLYEFAFKLDHHDKHDNRCKECCKKQNRHRKYLKETVREKPTVCECCGKSVLEQSKNRKPISLFLDHDHKTGKFRGWICHDCNSALGRAGDDLAGVMNLMRYLQKHEQTF